MARFSFFKEGINNIKTVGSLARSSPSLCNAMLKPVDFFHARVIIELGPGDGVITKHILARMHHDCKLVSFEIQSGFCEHLRKQIHDPRFILIEDSAENIVSHLTELNLGFADYIISAIPFSLFPIPLREKIVTQSREALKPGGLFIQFHYTTVLRKLYSKIFGNVNLNFIPINFPPAFVMTCKKHTPILESGK